MLYNIVLRNVTKRYDYEELVKMFLHNDEYEIHALEQKVQGTYITAEELEKEAEGLENCLYFTLAGDTKEDRNALKKEIYQALSEITGIQPPWGTLTGVRPVKLCGMLDSPYETLTEDYCVSEDKAKEIIDIYNYQQKMLKPADEKTIGIYIGIPFCPTRCLYCSFTSNQPRGNALDEYLGALVKEIRYCGKKVTEQGLNVESIYIGGGTPTTLSEEQLELLLDEISSSFDTENLAEYTVEAGRPDTITEGKLRAIKEHSVGRISINPQSMKDETLVRIGRSHDSKAIEDAFRLADKVQIPVVNADLIAGLPGETGDDFRESLNRIISLGAENITVHSLAVKKASRLIEADPEYHFRSRDTVSEMIKTADEILPSCGYVPYYLYRQKHMSGSLENVGYCKDDTLGLYNIRIMDETQSILAIGAGAISKRYFPEENRIERVANVSNYEIYIERIDEMIQRKEENYFNWR